MEASRLRKRLDPHLVRREPPGQSPFDSVSEVPLVELASESGRSLRRVMIDCLKAGVWPERFRAQRGSMSAEDQARLLDSCAAVIGAGGLGGHVILLLARTGVGRLAVCDGDRFDESNLNRQALAWPDRLGRNKARVAAERVADLNPACQVLPFPAMATPENIGEVLGPARVVVDCLDRIETRLMVERAARERGLPFIHGAVAGLEGLIMTVFPDDPGLEGVYGSQAAAKEDSAEVVLGVPTVSPAAVAAFQAAEAVRLLLGREPAARGRLLHLDLSVFELESFTLA
ncbi:MAG: HesA/MoeB/ThiF family protein [Proteobacteria bacterium]|nr:HesA/MoeB/ThiF family protein [Pseudomonadota bacterium]